MASRFNLPDVDPATIPATWLATPPPPSQGQPVKVYRGFARNVEGHARQVVREGETGGILSCDPAAAHDAVFNQYGRDPVLDGPQAGGVVEITIPPDLWDELVRTRGIAERGGYPGFARRINTTEIRVNSPEAGLFINPCLQRILPPDRRFDYRQGR
jgi:hypothetical protein